MKLYADNSKPEVGVWCADRVIKVKVGLYPIGIHVQLVALFCISLMFMAVFLLLDLKLLWGLGYGSGVDYEGDWMGLLLLGIFLISGPVILGWCANYLMMQILPFSAEIDIDAKTMCYGNRLWRRKCYFGDEALLVVEPCYNRGDWGFSMKIIAKGRRCLLLPGVFVGSYDKAISRARNLATRIQNCMPYVSVKESKYWHVH